MSINFKHNYIRVKCLLTVAFLLFATEVKTETPQFILAIKTELKALYNIPDTAYQFETGQLYYSKDKCERTLLSNFFNKTSSARKPRDTLLIESYLGRYLAQQFRCIEVQKIFVD